MNNEDFVAQMKKFKRADRLKTRTGKSKEYLNKLSKGIHNKPKSRHEKKKVLIGDHWDPVLDTELEVEQDITIVRIGYKK